MTRSRASARRWVGALSLAIIATSLLGGDARASERRFAIVIGANEGEAGEEPLRYAEKDAERFAQAAVELGGVPVENLVLLRGADAATVERVLRSVGERLRLERTGNDRSSLFLYYSGHADSVALHLGRSRLSFKRLKQAVEDVGADVSIFIVDACKSGGLTRIKGAKQVKPFEISAEDTMDSSGLAIITSSAASEDAQESDRLRGSFFTHHLVNGLSGAADTSKDARVSLSEAYDYAYRETLRDTSRTAVVQHPTYAFRISGQNEYIMARLDASERLGRLRLADAGRYVLIADGDGDGDADVGGRIVELGAEGTTDVMLTPGDYLVRRRGEHAIFESNVRLGSSEMVTVSRSDMREVPYGATVRKGQSDLPATAWRVGITGELGSPLIDGASAMGFLAPSVQLDLEPLTLQLRARWGQLTTTNEDLTLIHDIWGVDLTALKLIDVADVLGIGIGVRVGVDVHHQGFDGTATAADRSYVAPRVAPVARVEYVPTANVAAWVDCGADIYALEVLDGGGSGKSEAPVVGFCSLGIGMYLP